MNEYQRHYAPQIFAESSPLDRHLKRLSRPVHGGRMDPKKAKRVYKARAKTSVGEYWNNRRKMDDAWLFFRQKHNLAPRGPKHNSEEGRIIRGMARVHADNMRIAAEQGPWKKMHKPSLGPYTETNLCVCVDCGKPRGDWETGAEECRP